MESTATKSNFLKYTTILKTKEYTYEVKITLGDECKNGFQGFAITATAWSSKVRKRGVNNWDHCGALGDEIVKAFPQFEIFHRLHGCDYLGTPTYPVSNGMYHMGKKEVAMRYLRITEDEYAALCQIQWADEPTRKASFTAKLGELGIKARWESEANEGIKQLETLTGCEFVMDSVKTHWSYEK